MKAKSQPRYRYRNHNHPLYILLLRFLQMVIYLMQIAKRLYTCHRHTSFPDRSHLLHPHHRQQSPSIPFNLPNLAHPRHLHPDHMSALGTTHPLPVSHSKGSQWFALTPAGLCRHSPRRRRRSRSLTLSALRRRKANSDWPCRGDHPQERTYVEPEIFLDESELT